MQSSFSTQSTHIRPFGNGNRNERTRATCVTPTPQQPSTPLLSSSMCATGVFNSVSTGMIRPM
jgi:hypothetical protein